MRKYVFVLVGLFMGVGLARMSATQAPAALVERDGLQLMRRLMSAQANPPFAGNAGSLADIVGNARSGAASMVADIDPATGAILDYTVRVAPNGSRYEISLTPQSGCGTAWFGNEKNVIYAGKALGC